MHKASTPAVHIPVTGSPTCLAALSCYVLWAQTARPAVHSRHANLDSTNRVGHSIRRLFELENHYGPVRGDLFPYSPFAFQPLPEVVARASGLSSYSYSTEHSTSPGRLARIRRSSEQVLFLVEYEPHCQWIRVFMRLVRRQTETRANEESRIVGIELRPLS